jgi:hypothetical protein
MVDVKPFKQNTKTAIKSSNQMDQRTFTNKAKDDYFWLLFDFSLSKKFLRQLWE